jgi:tRNA G26 N,N-dimethylase Trm1
MLHPSIIERAFQLAPTVTTVAEVRSALKSEGYSSVDEHLAGPSIKADLKKRFMRSN